MSRRPHLTYLHHLPELATVGEKCSDMVGNKSMEPRMQEEEEPWATALMKSGVSVRIYGALDILSIYLLYNEDST